LGINILFGVFGYMDAFSWYLREGIIAEGRAKRTDFDLEELRDHFNKGGTIYNFSGATASEIQRWCEDDPDFSYKLARLKRNTADMHVHIAQQALFRLLDESMTASQAKVAIDSSLKIAGKIDPSSYGDRMKIDQDTNVKMRQELDPEIIDYLDSNGIVVDES